MSTRFPHIAALLVMFVWFTKPSALAIINGKAPLENEFPWIAALVKKGDFSTVPLIGGGALVGDQWILTTAHSLVGRSPSDLEIWLGTPNLSDTSGRIRRNVLAIYRHPDFVTTNGTSSADVAMLLLDEPVTGISPVPFETTEEDLRETDEVTTAGWGTTTPGVNAPGTELQKAHLELMTRGNANAFYGNILTIDHIPARDPLFLTMPCFGDSGGPLLKSIDGVETLIGLVSFGPAECDNAAIPSIFTNVTAYDEWIQERLDATALPSNIVITGRGNLISNGDNSPRATDNTDFGTLPTRRRSRTRVFRVENRSSGLLTVRSITESGRRFSIRSSPAQVIGDSGSSPFRVRFRSPGRKVRALATVRLFTNDPSDPIVSFRVRARVR